MTMTKCPTCKKENALRDRESSAEICGLEVRGRGLACRFCDEFLIANAELARMEAEAASVMVARGIRDGRQFQFVRKELDITAVDLAKLLGVRPETISRWERGEYPVDRAAAFALGELFERPRVVRAKLEALATHL
ncbi:MAG: helix-turn-helix domain-containing protein [Deltaproteobacteria bacterium]|nr:helix-turn-helix domain-containing protein [Deltaproteobacteria bacterium]